MQSTETPCFSTALTARQPTACRLLASALGRGRMAHALLLTGRATNDKWLIARQLAAFLNCQSERKNEAGSCLLSYLNEGEHSADGSGPDDKTFSLACQNCRWLYKDEHPKAWTVLSREAGKSGKIPVETARNLSEELAKSSQYLRVVVIDDASDSAFHRPAANALLKTIEEPRSNCLFVLFGQVEEDVLETIVSRCQLIPLNNHGPENTGALAKESPPLKERMKSRSALAADEEVQGLRSEIFLSAGPGKKVHVKDALAFAHRMLDVMDDDNYEGVFDLLVDWEIDKLGGNYRTHMPTSRYVKNLFKLAEEAKREWDRYVTKKGVCEAFVLGWLELRQNLIR